MDLKNFTLPQLEKWLKETDNYPKTSKGSFIKTRPSREIMTKLIEEALALDETRKESDSTFNETMYQTAMGDDIEKNLNTSEGESDNDKVPGQVEPSTGILKNKNVRFDENSKCNSSKALDKNDVMNMMNQQQKFILDQMKIYQQNFQKKLDKALLHVQTNVQNNATIPQVDMNLGHQLQNLESQLNQATISEARRFRTIHPWSVHSSWMGMPEIKRMEEIDDWIVIKCISRHIAQNVIGGSDLEKQRSQMLAYAISKCHRLETDTRDGGMSSRSVLKNLVRSIDISLLNNMPLSFSNIDQMSIEYQIQSEKLQYNAPFQFGQGPYGFRANNSAQKGPSSQICYQFNKKEGCKIPSCGYSHHCRSCYEANRGFKNHSAYRCSVGK